MNIIQRLFAIFGRQYVLLEFHDGKTMICHAYAIGTRAFAHPYLSYTRVELLPGGKIGNGPSYIHTWYPITKKPCRLYDCVKEAA